MEFPRLPIVLTVNGTPTELAVFPHHTVLAVLRDQLRLTGTKECCSEGECGACTVLLNGLPVNACLLLAPELDGQHVTTIEGLSSHGHLTALQQAFLDHGAVQSGFCIPGMLMAATAFLEANPRPDRPAIQEALSGNLCRCAGYSRIIAAVMAASGRAE